MSLYKQTLVRQVVEKQDLTDDAVKFALDYFSYFFHNPALGELTEENVPQYVKHFQDMIGVEADGELDSQVIHALKTMPRCGCRDYSMITPEAFGNAPRWGVRPITYYVEKQVSGLSGSDQDDLLQKSFDAWASVADLQFKRVNSQNANIIVSTGRGSGDNFDGPSGTLAWAYLPPQVNFKGQLLMRFDLDETWIKSSTDRGILYLNVATHEIGHLLGLEHSQQSKALMAPYYAVGITKPQQVDDVTRIQELYGKPTAPPPPPGGGGGTPAGKIKVEIMVNSMADIKINGKNSEEGDEPDFDMT